MKKAFILILFIITGFAACKKDVNDPAYDKSYKAWQNFKAESKNSYTYTVTSGSVFGFGSETKITVEKGAVTARDYYSYRLEYQQGSNVPPTKKTLELWHEDKAAIGQHSSGALAITLEEVYKKAKNEWLSADKSKNTVYFENKNNGMISMAVYVPNGCQDDCSIGIHISEIKAL
ncbi:hypothetical protein AAFN85_26060 [Mucilaginibacter sp. CAU 1740]|uniref:hypothetical protein n=1 Tax=Mucilaginibacter sp. CAU 1740 TaxID=3140365 RepID=UPI00325BF998